jgi:hypothetical protein
MTRKIGRTAGVLLCAAGVLGLAAPPAHAGWDAWTPVNAAATNTAKIGVIAPLSGDLSALGR